MNPKLLKLAALPTVSGFMVVLPLGHLVYASQIVEPAATSCQISTSPKSMGGDVKSNESEQDLASATVEIPIEYPVEEYSAEEYPVEDHPMADFTIAESDAAVELFGCDCMACINALRQLRSQSLEQLVASNNQGHCWTSLQRRVSPQDVQNVLETLE